MNDRNYMQFSAKFFFSICLISCLAFAGCMESPYFQKTVSVPENQWTYDYQPVFKVDINDTAALYHLYFVIRHTEAYPFSNLWMWIDTKEPGDTTYNKSRIEIPLAEKSGKWMGRGMGEIWEQRMPITRDDAPMVFKKTGTYEFKFEQNMRINPLPEVLQVGLRIEKIGYKKEKK